MRDRFGILVFKPSDFVSSTGAARDPVGPGLGGFRGVLAELGQRDGLDLSGLSKAFGNDVLLALSCREAGIVLVTDNQRDYARIAGVVAFEFVKPWPAPTSR